MCYSSVLFPFVKVHANSSLAPENSVANLVFRVHAYKPSYEVGASVPIKLPAKSKLSLPVCVFFFNTVFMYFTNVLCKCNCSQCCPIVIILPPEFSHEDTLHFWPFFKYCLFYFYQSYYGNQKRLLLL